jgi:hypothetical protein
MMNVWSTVGLFVLGLPNLPSSHRLHYLQMWLEKLCKAYL